MSHASFLHDAVAQAFVAACEDELRAPKPGNVHHFAAGHGMEARDFILSAHAAAVPLTAPGASVGARILGAVEATWAAVGQNTNLGIVLLCAPLAHAALEEEGPDLRGRLAHVLRGLDRADADMAFRAIMRASPAGLGSSGEHDVAAPAQTTLLAAMTAAADRDRVAFQYASDFSDIFGSGLAVLTRSQARGETRDLATLRLYVHFLSAFPDSHIARKYDAATARGVMAEALQFSRELDAAPDRDAAFAAALVFDAALKNRRLNPGACADLTVATLFAESLIAILARGLKNG